MSEDLTLFSSPELKDVVQDMRELLSQSRLAFLLGAGCSMNAGLPLMPELTKKVLGQPGVLAIADNLSNSTTLTGHTLDELQRKHIRAVCKTCEWKIDGAGNAADMLDINPNTLRSRMKKLGISRPGKNHE